MQYLERNFRESNEPWASENKTTVDEDDSLQSTLLKFVRKKKDGKKIERIIEESGPRILTDCDTILLLRSAKKYGNYELFKLILDSKSENDVALPDPTSLITTALQDDWPATRLSYKKNVNDVISQLYENRKRRQSTDVHARDTMKRKEERWAKVIVARDTMSKLMQSGQTIERIAKLLHEFHWEVHSVVKLENPELTRSFLQLNRPRFDQMELLQIFAIFAKNVNVRHLQVFLDYNYDLPHQRPMAWDLFRVLTMHASDLNGSAAGRAFIKMLPRYEFYNDAALERLQDSLVQASRENLEVLLSYEFRAVMMSRCGRDILTAAYANHDRAVLELLKIVKVDVNARGCVGWTPLHWAVQTRAMESVRHLLARGADPNALDELGLTPLNLALRFGICYDGTMDEECVKLLLIGGADPLLTYERANNRTCFFCIAIYKMRQSNYRNIAKCIAAQIAIEEALGKKVAEPLEHFMKLRSEEFDCVGFYEQCREQLAKLKTQKFRNNLNLSEQHFNMFAILSGKKDKIARRIDENDQRIIAAFMKEYESEELFYYCDVLKYRLQIIDRMTTFIDTTRRILSECMQISDKRHLVIQKIVDYLSCKDLLTSK